MPSDFGCKGLRKYLVSALDKNGSKGGNPPMQKLRQEKTQTAAYSEFRGKWPKLATFCFVGSHKQKQPTTKFRAFDPFHTTPNTYPFQMFNDFQTVLSAKKEEKQQASYLPSHQLPSPPAPSPQCLWLPPRLDPEAERALPSDDRCDETWGICGGVKQPSIWLVKKTGYPKKTVW